MDQESDPSQVPSGGEHSHHSPCPKKHKKHKKERDEKPGLKLILKVGSNNTPEHEQEYLQQQQQVNPDGTLTEPPTIDLTDDNSACALHKSHHKKSKKKKKKKDKSKDREKDREKRHKHHHKDKKRKREELENEQEGLINDIKPNPLFSQESTAVTDAPSPEKIVKKLFEGKSPLSKALEQLLLILEKKDSQNFFALPVTDAIAPGYSKIINNPMDFSSMKKKIEDNGYDTLKEFTDDFQLMCNNAMKYNTAETVYFKASRKLLQFGMKIIQADKLGWLLAISPELTEQELGFEVTPEMQASASQNPSILDTDVLMDDDSQDDVKMKKMPATKFEAIPDDLTAEEILAQAKSAARLARVRLKGSGPPMGFLKQKRDGTTHLNILLGSNVNKKPAVPLGQLVGKLSEGTAQLQGFREDRRNVAKPVKPLYYGAFGSYAPSHDSAFANLTKEESALVLRTYGSDQAVQYAESVQDFVRGCDYAERLVDSLLDLLTGGDHTRTKSSLEDSRLLKDEEEAVRTVLESKPSSDNMKVNMDELRSLKDIGIDTGFLEGMEEDLRIAEEKVDMQEKLNDMCKLLEKLQKAQYSRLSQPLHGSLHHINPPTLEEGKMATAVTDGLSELVKKTTPGNVASVPGVRRALGVEVAVPEPLPDLETELRKFLEREQAPLVTDKTIEEILMD